MRRSLNVLSLTALRPGLGVRDAEGDGRTYTTLTLSNQAGQADVTAYYSVGNNGTGSFFGIATAGGVADTGYRVVPVAPPPGAPKVNLSYWLDSVSALSRCSVGCFAAQYAQSTVPYFTLDAARGVTLVYQGDRVAPKAFVLADIQPDTTFGGTPTEYRLGVRFGSIQYPFVNGDTILHFAYPASNPTKPYRLGGQIATDTTSNFTHGVAYAMDIDVSAKISGTVYTNRYHTRYLSVNESGSPIARGWTVAGIQRAWNQTDGSLLITDGTGDAVYFGKTGSTFVTPTGEFSRVTSIAGGYLRAYPDSFKVFLNTSGLTDSVKDRFGNRTFYQYDISGRLQYIWDPIMQLITLTYGTYGLSSITDASGRVTTFTVVANRTLTAMTDPDTVATGFGYDGSGRLSTITDRNGAITTLGYDSQGGKLASITSPSIPIFGAGSQSPVTTLAAWQKRGVPFTSTLITPFTMPKSDTVFARVTDPEGHQTKFTVNRWGQPLVTTDALGQVTTLHYTAGGFPDSTVVPGYGVNDFDRLIYNADGFPTLIVPAGGDTTFISYGGWAQPTRVVAKGRDSTGAVLGTNGRVDTLKLGGAVAQSFTYDSRGRVLLTRNALGDTVQRVTYLPNTYQNVDSMFWPGRRWSRIIHDNAGRPATLVDSLLPPDFRWYSRINRVDSTMNRAGWKTYYTYDHLYLTKVTLPANIKYQATYNALGWPTTRKDPQGHVDSLFYDRDGLLKRTKTRRLLTVDFVYDQLHRPTSQAGGTTITWSYNDAARKVTAVSAQSTDTSYSTLLGLPSKVVTVLAGRAYTQTYHYTTAGLLDTVRITGLASDSFVTRTYSYNTGHGTISTIGLRGQTTGLNYDANDNVTRFIYPFTGVDSVARGGLTAANKHDSETANNSFLQRWMGYSYAGQIDRHLQNAAKRGRWFTYDSLGQLRKGVDKTRTPESIPANCPSYNYGMSGACTPLPDYLASDSSMYLYGATGNRLDLNGNYDTTFTRITFFKNCNYTTDLEGHTTSRTTGSFTCAQPIDSLVWNAEGQLTRLAFPGGLKVAFYYDAFGRLVRKDSASVKAYFLWQGDQLLAQLDSTASTKAGEYAYYPGLDNPQAWIKGQSIYRARLDGLGSVIALTDSASRIRRFYGYDDWGQLIPGADSIGANNRDRVRWKGALWMGPEADLYFMRNRWYEPATGRFLSEDPIGLDGGMNLFAYTSNDPVDGSDASGLQQQLPDLEVWGRSNWLNGWLGWLASLPYRGNDLAYFVRPTGGGGSGAKSHNERRDLTLQFKENERKQCIEDYPLRRLTDFFTPTFLLNLKAPWDWGSGRSLWTSLDRRLGLRVVGGAEVRTVGRVGRVKSLGKAGSIAVAVSGFSAAYSLTARVSCEWSSR